MIQKIVYWLRKIESRIDNNTETAATFKKEILLKFKSIPEVEQKVCTNGSSCNEKDYTTAMFHLATYFDQKFTLSQYGCLFRVKPGHHNVDIAMKKLVQLRIMKGSLGKQGLIVYSLVDTLRIHIRYDEDDSLEDELNRLFMEGNAAIEARSLKKNKRKNASDGGKKRSQPKQRTNDQTRETLRAMKLMITWRLQKCSTISFLSKIWPLLPPKILLSNKDRPTTC